MPSGSGFWEWDERWRTRAEPIKLDLEMECGDDKTELKDHQVNMDVLRVVMGPWCTQAEGSHRSPQTAQAVPSADQSASSPAFPLKLSLYSTPALLNLIYIVSVIITCMKWPHSQCLNIYSCVGLQREGRQSFLLSAVYMFWNQSKFSGRALEDVESVCLRSTDRHRQTRGDDGTRTRNWLRSV